jgi:hypothetical protein
LRSVRRKSKGYFKRAGEIFYRFLVEGGKALGKEDEWRKVGKGKEVKGKAVRICRSYERADAGMACIPRNLEQSDKVCT